MGGKESLGIGLGRGGKGGGATHLLVCIGMLMSGVGCIAGEISTVNNGEKRAYICVSVYAQQAEAVQVHMKEITTSRL